MTSSPGEGKGDKWIPISEQLKVGPLFSEAEDRKALLGIIREKMEIATLEKGEIDNTLNKVGEALSGNLPIDEHNFPLSDLRENIQRIYDLEHKQ